MKPFGILLIAAGGLLLFFGGVVGFETGFGHLRVMNLPMVIMGGVGILSGVILFAADSFNEANSQIAGSLARPADSTNMTEEDITYDRNKWSALVKYDDEISLIAEKLKPLGQKWVDEFASSYLALNDKKYLPSLIHKIIASAKKEADLPPLPPLEGQQNLPFVLTQKSINILQQAKTNGYEVELSAKEKCVVARLKGLWLLGSNQEIDNFGRDTVSVFKLGG